MNAIINETNLNLANEKGKDGNSSFNCWGATLFILGAVIELFWATRKEITKFINEKTKLIEEDIKSGDILVLFQKNGKIIHTAVYITEEKLFHKRGNKEAEFTDEEGVKKVYYEYDNYEVRRVN